MSGRFDFSDNFRRAMARMKAMLENLPSLPVPPPIYISMLPRVFQYDTRTDDPLVVLAVAHELLPVEELGELGYHLSPDRVDQLDGFQTLPCGNHGNPA